MFLYSPISCSKIPKLFGVNVDRELQSHGVVFVMVMTLTVNR